MSSTPDTADFEALAAPPGWVRPQQFSALMPVDAHGLSHRGLVRAHNEDHFFVARFGRFLERLCTNLPEEEMPRRFEETGYGLVVADGLGGRRGGEVASRLAISTLINLVLGTPDWILRRDDDSLPDEVRRRMLERYGQISSVMAEQAQADPNLEGFGTTMTLALSLGKHLLVVHIGDSRAYLLRDHRLYRLTRDHTLVQELADRGLLSSEEVATHRLRHVLTKALLSKGGPVEPDVQELALADGDCLLLCTDGLTEMVQEERIAQVLGSGETSAKVCQCLIEEALQAGGKDNVTVVVARYGLRRGG
jgi:serine/threonine protein phosphatase PrpC